VRPVIVQIAPLQFAYQPSKDAFSLEIAKAGAQLLLVSEARSANFAQWLEKLYSPSAI
jgi:hypothetical protein